MIEGTDMRKMGDKTVCGVQCSLLVVYEDIDVVKSTE